MRCGNVFCPSDVHAFDPCTNARTAVFLKTLLGGAGLWTTVSFNLHVMLSLIFKIANCHDPCVEIILHGG